jgi:hypothetical protein
VDDSLGFINPAGALDLLTVLLFELDAGRRTTGGSLISHNVVDAVAFDPGDHGPGKSSQEDESAKEGEDPARCAGGVFAGHV